MIHVILIMEYTVTVWREGEDITPSKRVTPTPRPTFVASFSDILHNSRDLGVMLPYLGGTYIDTTVAVTPNIALFSMRVTALANNWYPWIVNGEVADNQTPKFHLSKSFSLSVS